MLGKISQTQEHKYLMFFPYMWEIKLKEGNVCIKWLVMLYYFRFNNVCLLKHLLYIGEVFFFSFSSCL